MFKNLIRNVLSKPVIWYLKFKKWDGINVIINIDGTHLEKRNLESEQKLKESLEKARKQMERL